MARSKVLQMGLYQTSQAKYWLKPHASGTKHSTTVNQIEHLRISLL